MNPLIENYVDTLHRTHMDNARSCYQAVYGPNSANTISPITNLIFELFLFNSLYSVDWDSTFKEDSLTFFDTGRDGPSEPKKQREFIKACKHRIDSSTQFVLADAFSPLAGHLTSDRDWMRVQPDDRITTELGEKFFRDIVWIANTAQERSLFADKVTFKAIDSCTYFVYLVRNNIFHGQKRLGEIYDRDHLKRLSIYDLFIRCVNSMFFKLMGKPDFGSVYAQYPIRLCHSEQSSFEIPVDKVAHLAFSKRALKPLDSYLHWLLSRECLLTSHFDIPRGIMFYPSAGNDLLFPLIVGLPYCDEFHFFDQSLQYVAQRVIQTLRILGVRPQDVDATRSGSKVCLEFELFGFRRRIWLRREDNLSFLNEQTPIRFYFHRGDSNGEGGSDQNWDGSLLQELVARADERGLLVVTDGQPGGLTSACRNRLREVLLPAVHLPNIFYVGTLHKNEADLE
jgi:hypothetical protein